MNMMEGSVVVKGLRLWLSVVNVMKCYMRVRLVVRGEYFLTEMENEI